MARRRSARAALLRLVSLGIASLAAATGSASAVELKGIAALATNREMTQSFVRFFVGAVNEKGKGTIEIKFLGGPEVMPPDKQAAAVGRGAMDIAHVPSSYYAGTVPEGQAVLVSNMTPAEVRKSGGFDLLDQAHQKKMNVKVIAWGDAGGTYNTYLSKKPIMNADGSISLKGYKMRSTATYRPLFTFLGATSIAMPSGDIFTAMQRGVIDGFGSPSSGLVALGVKGTTKYRIDPPYYNLNNLVMVNLNRWNALPQAAKDVLNAVAIAYEDQSTKFYLEFATKEEQELIAAGMEIIKLGGKAAQDYLDAANMAIWEQFEKRTDGATRQAFQAKFMK